MTSIMQLGLKEKLEGNYLVSVRKKQSGKDLIFVFGKLKLEILEGF